VILAASFMSAEGGKVEKWKSRMVIFVHHSP
jgi:hypothetical protein